MGGASANQPVGLSLGPHGIDEVGGASATDVSDHAQLGKGIELHDKAHTLHAESAQFSPWHLQLERISGV